MRTFTLLFALVLMFAFAEVNAQCAACTVDFGALTEPGLSPGPDSIPCIDQGVAYDETIQFYNFDTTTFNGQILTIDSLEVDSVAGLPTGIDWGTNNADNRFGNQEKGCIRLCGTTNEPVGNYQLQIFAKVWASFYPNGGNFPVYPLTIDAASVSENLAIVLKVKDPADPCVFGTGIADLLDESSLSIVPNPAVNTAMISFTAKENSEYNLNIVDMSGRTVVSRAIEAMPGQNNFEVDVTALSNGVYMYSLTNGRESVSQSFVIAH